jgi:site-specific recombinase XerD
LDTGLRISEAVNIRVSDLDLKEGVVRVRGKGNKERIVILSDRVIAAIEKYLKTIDTLELNGTVPPGLCHRGFNILQITKELGIPGGSIYCAINQKPIRSGLMKKLKTYIENKVKTVPLGFLFSNLGGEKLGTRHAFRIIKEIGKKAGIKDLHPHTLRHTHATNLRRKGADLLLIKESLGHSSVQTTEVYAHLGNDEYREKMRQLINS